MGPYQQGVQNTATLHSNPQAAWRSRDSGRNYLVRRVEHRYKRLAGAPCTGARPLGRPKVAEGVAPLFGGFPLLVGCNRKPKGNQLLLGGKYELESGHR